MPNLGTKYVCFSCQTKFYDLGRNVAVCPKCGADQKDADSSPAPVSKSRRVVETVDPAAEVEESTGSESEDEEIDVGDDDTDSGDDAGSDDEDDDDDYD